MLLFSRPALLVLLTALPVFAGCSSGQTPQATQEPGPYCGSSDPCGCVTNKAVETCVADGITCVCSPNTMDSGPADSGEAVDAPPPDPGVFVGQWSPISGTGEANCSGQIVQQPPNTGAIITLTQDSASTLSATSSGAPGCTLQLRVSGTTASLDLSSTQTYESCTDPTGGFVMFTLFNLVFIPAAGATDGGVAPDGAVDTDGGVDSGGADSGADGAPSSGDVDAGPPPRDTLDWQLGSVASCDTSLHYTLARVH